VIPHDHPIPLLPGNGAVAGFVLIDGDWNALWKLDRGTATITITPFTSLDPATRDALINEATSLLTFLAPAQQADIQIITLRSLFAAYRFPSASRFSTLRDRDGVSRITGMTLG
jgi:hypothetical protein